MRFIVLGSAAGGGLPQWNCACANCEAARRSGGVRARTQSSLAVRGDGEGWAIINASPDIGAQLRQTAALWPDKRRGARHSPIAEVYLTNADIDHIAGLLTLREGHVFDLLATRSVLETLAGNRIFDVLGAERVTRNVLETEAPRRLSGAGEVTVTAFSVPGKVALFLETAATLGRLGERGEDTIGLEFHDRARNRRAIVIPGCAEIDQPLKDRIDGADVLFFDGTLFDDDEMIAAGLSAKTGRRMGHVPISGAGGTLEALGDVAVGRRIFVHINNSNPIVCPSHEAAREVERAGWEIAHDGLEIAL